VFNKDLLGKMNFAQVLEHRTASPETREKTFIMAFEKETSDFFPITFETFYQEALRYGNLIEAVRRKKVSYMPSKRSHCHNMPHTFA